MMVRALLITGFALSAALAGALPAGGEAQAPVVQISHVTGKPVPRFETLRYAAVNGRTGPSEDHSIAWRYERRGLPVLILKESQSWARVRDPDGDEVWIHRRTLQPGTTAMVKQTTQLRAGGNIAARSVAEIENGVMVSWSNCQDRFCEVTIDNTTGWVLESHLWGVGLDHSAE
ncbi:MAG: SH3 domain-containing protein [Pseudomonadota bacterium]